MRLSVCMVVGVLLVATAVSAAALDVPPTAIAQAAAWEADSAAVAQRRAAHAEALVGATPASYDLDLALRLMHMCAAAYCPTGIQTWTCNACTSPGFNVSTVVTEKTWGLLAFVGYDPVNNTVVVSFRGSDNLPNWILDLWATQTHTKYPHCDCEVESGFYKAHEELKPQIVPVVHQLLALNPGSTLHITGHSLGAAMAVLSAAHIQTQENISVAELYTFGLPRVGDTAFSKWFHQAVPQAIHVTHYHDIVPHLPPQWLFGYHHTPTEVWYDAETGLDNYKVCDGTGEDPTCADSVHFWDYSTKDHCHYLDYPICGCVKPPTTNLRH